MSDSNDDDAPRKRVADHQLTVDDNPDDDPEHFATTPQIASPEELAKRRILRARPMPGSTAATSAATEATGTSAKKSGGFFKFLDTAASTAGAPAPPPPALPQTFSFGSNISAPHRNGTSATPTSTFSFGFGTIHQTPGSSGAPGPASTKPSFSFGLPTASGTPASATAQTHTLDRADDTTKDTHSDSHASTSRATAPLFGSGAFSFGNAVNSFVEARKKMENARTESTGALGDATRVPHSGHANDPNTGASADADGASSSNEGDATQPGESLSSGGGGTAVVPAPGEVLVSASTKLFAFIKEAGAGTGSWVERGAGEAKIKKQNRGSGESGADATSATPSEEGQQPHEVYRLLVRDGYSLNVTLIKGALLLTKEEAKHIVFTVATKDGVVTYLLKFVGPNAEAASAQFTAELKRVLDVVNAGPAAASSPSVSPKS